MTWRYDLTDGELEQYRSVYKKFYDVTLVSSFDKAVAINRERMLREKSRKDKANQAIMDFHRCVVSEHKLVLYGGGYWAELIS